MYIDEKDGAIYTIDNLGGIHIQNPDGTYDSISPNEGICDGCKKFSCEGCRRLTPGKPLQVT